MYVAESAMDYMHKGVAVKTKKNHYQVGDQDQYIGTSLIRSSM